MIFDGNRIHYPPGPPSRELLPWRFILRPPTRSAFAAHLLSMRRQYGLAVALAAVDCAIVNGCYPVRLHHEH